MSAQMESNQDSPESWLPIVDYAVLRGVSTSTLRRYIKAKKIQYKIENGRYLLFADEEIMRRQRGQSAIERPPLWDELATHKSMSVYERVKELEAKLMGAQEQVNELKMLVAIYEEKLAPADH